MYFRAYCKNDDHLVGVTNRLLIQLTNTSINLYIYFNTILKNSRHLESITICFRKYIHVLLVLSYIQSLKMMMIGTGFFIKMLYTAVVLLKQYMPRCCQILLRILYADGGI